MVRFGRTMTMLAVSGGALACLVWVPRGYSEEEKPDKAPESARKLPPYRPVAPVLDLMEAQDHFFSAIKEQLRARDKEDFLDIQISANVLAELCNVNQYQKDKPDYQQWAMQARDLALELARAAKAKDATGANRLLREIHTRCTDCHDKYQ